MGERTGSKRGKCGLALELVEVSRGSTSRRGGGGGGGEGGMSHKPVR